MKDFRTPEEWELILSRQVHNLRMLRNMDQRTLAEQAGVALNVVKRLESGKTSTTKSLIKVLRVLNRAEWLETLAPTITVNPLQVMPSKAPRQKVYSARQRKPKTTTAKEALLLCTDP